MTQLASFLAPLSAHLKNTRNLSAVVKSRRAARQTVLRLSEIADSDKPIVIGPWLSEIGFEVLYWIPFLNWAMDRFALKKESVTIISRGDNRSWYSEIGTNYVNILDFMGPEEFKHGNIERAKETGRQKQMALSGFDQAILNYALKDLDATDFHLIHPSLMNTLFGYFWSGMRPISLIHEHSVFRLLPTAALRPVDGLPPDYVAAKFYFSDCFPDSRDNRAFILNLLANVMRTDNVVLLDTGIDLDDHADFALASSKRLFSISEMVRPENNLDVQTRVLAHAKVFIGTYGGFSYLGPVMGIDSFSAYSAAVFQPLHLQVAEKAFTGSDFGSFTAFKTQNFDVEKLTGAIAVIA